MRAVGKEGSLMRLFGNITYRINHSRFSSLTYIE